MVKKEDFKRHATTIVDWIDTYFRDVENYSVRSACHFGDVLENIPEGPPASGEGMDAVFDDFKNIILPGITHWQSPGYSAYFPANSSIPSVLAEFLTAALGVQGMKWITSPAATELEQRMMEWLRQMLDLPADFKGVIQDTASVSNLCALIAAREHATQFESNRTGMFGKILRVYCSTEAHSSIDKAIRIAGFGLDNLVKIEVNAHCEMISSKLEEAIQDDIAAGYVPACIVGALGTTGTCAFDPLEELGAVAQKYNCWFHIDAAFAGSALVLSEFREKHTGIRLADSFVFNPHKWMFTNFDCSAFYVKNPSHLQRTFTLVPGYLQTDAVDEVNDYSNWSIQLGRRFRALKLWFVIRDFGVEGIRQKFRQHIEWSAYFENWVKHHPDFELIVPRNLTVTCFRYADRTKNTDELNQINRLLLERINDSGKLFISHTFVQGKYSLRFVCAQTNTEKKHVTQAIAIIEECTKNLSGQ